MKYISIISIFFIVFLTSCNKEDIRPNIDSDELMETRGQNRSPENNNGEGGGITDPDNETEDEKVKNRKRKAK